jgi:hypothetical protein
MKFPLDYDFPEPVNKVLEQGDWAQLGSGYATPLLCDR